MIAADTNTWIAYLSGGKGDDVTVLDTALADQVLRMIPAHGEFQFGVSAVVFDRA